MFNSKFVFIFLVFAALGYQGIAHAANTRVTNPSAIALEIGGRGLLYSVSFDRVLSEQLAAGIGFGTVSTNLPSGASSGVNATLLPAYVNFYFSEDAGSLYLTGGGSVVTNAGSLNNLSSSVGGLQFSSNPVIFHFGLGYEYRSDAGYLVRLTGYGLVGSNFAPWGGITFGYSF